MNDTEYLGWAKKEEYPELMELVDGAFDSKARGFSFVMLLPRVFKEKYGYAGKNIVLKADGEMKAAVGIYNDSYKVAGENLVCSGIANVAVHNDSRHKGYMIRTMNRAMQEAVRSGADYAALRGNRQRYEYFSFTPAGQVYRFTVLTRNLQHVFGQEFISGLTVREVNEEDGAAAEQIGRLFKSSDFHSERPEAALADYLRSWMNIPYAVFEEDSFAGYYVLSRDKKTVNELKAADTAMLPRMLKAIFEETQSDEITFCVPPFDAAYVDFFYGIAERSEIKHPLQFSVFKYERVVRAFMKLKAAGEPLAWGRCVLLIHGFAGDENIEISVGGHGVRVEKSSLEPDLELGHLEAVSLLFGLYSPLRKRLRPEASSWFPLPIFCYECDGV